MTKEELTQKITELENQMASPDFWSNPKHAQEVIKEVQELKLQLEGGSKHARGNARITIFAGAGGDDAEDFVRILFEMYMKFADLHNFGFSILDESPNELNGYRNISFEITGKGAYGMLENESGVHRLVRKSPFNAKGKRQTGFALVEVLPEIETTEFVLDESELEITFNKSQGAGGQNVNKRETAVRIVHPKTGFSLHVSKERSQERNRELAMSLMRAKLYKKHLEDEEKKSRGQSISDKVSIEWGNQIRSYVFDPYQMVKDHRDGTEVRDVDKVLAGDLSDFIKKGV